MDPGGKSEKKPRILFRVPAFRGGGGVTRGRERGARIMHGKRDPGACALGPVAPGTRPPEQYVLVPPDVYELSRARIIKQLQLDNWFACGAGVATREEPACTGRGRRAGAFDPAPGAREELGGWWGG